MRSILMRMFGRPQGVLGRLGGVIMGRMNADCGAWVSDLLEVGPNDSVLEVGFGPGVTIQRLSRLAGRWLSRLRLGIQLLSRADMSTCGTALWKACHSATIAFRLVGH
jgi:hypothetical protein